MIYKYRLRKNKIKGLCAKFLLIFNKVLPIIACVYIGEVIYPAIHISGWNKPDSKPMNDEVRLVAVADPHVSGYEPSLYLLNYILQADNDRFLAIYYQNLIKIFKPHSVLFLGDLLDRGAVSSTMEFADAAERFKKIYFGTNISKYILLPGDNDIGGEDQPVTVERVHCFWKYFGRSNGTVSLNFVDIYSKPDESGSEAIITSEIDNRTVRLYASHVPSVFPSGAGFSSHLLKSKPHILLSAHSHCPYVLRWTSRKVDGKYQSQIDTVQSPDGRLVNTPINLKIHDSIHTYFNLDSEVEAEGQLIAISVPSCTYRSGYPKYAGLGLLQIFSNYTITYTLLPLPNRYVLLLIYSALISLTLFWHTTNQRNYPFTICFLLIILYAELRIFFKLSRDKTAF